MGTLFLILLEIIRILALFGIYSAIVTYIVNYLCIKFGFAVGDFTSVALLIFCFSTFYFWYQKKGRNSGWYKA